MDSRFTMLIENFRRRVKLQQVPIEYDSDDYVFQLIEGIKQLYVDLGITEEFEADFDYKNLSFNRNLTITEEEYILVCASIYFYQVVQQDVNTIVGYSTDSLTITNADKPYANISNEINKLTTRQTELFWKLRAEREA